MADLYAVIRPESKYANQSDGTPFPVRLGGDITDGYLWHGGIGGRYRHSDLQLMQKVGGEFETVPFFYEERQYFDILLNRMEKDCAAGNYWADDFDRRIDLLVERLKKCKRVNRDNQDEEE